jgi:hypothetical protein
MPRFKEGIPITLGVVKGQTSSRTPLVEAYPDYEMQSSPTKNQCDQIISVFGIAVSTAFF